MNAHTSPTAHSLGAHRLARYRDARAQRRIGAIGWFGLTVTLAVLATCVSVAAVAGPAPSTLSTASPTTAPSLPVMPTATPAPTPAPTPASSPSLALVLQDQTALRGAAREAGAALAQLWRGEVVEVRGERLDHLQVWDHRRERGGFVRKSQLHRIGSQSADAPELLALLRFVQHQPSAEALGIGLAAAYIQAASGAQLGSAEGATALLIMGRLAERLADRASAQSAAQAASGGLTGGSTSGMNGIVASPAPAPSRASETALAAHLEVAARYGLRFIAHEQEGGRIQLCYEGDAFRRVLGIAQDAELRAIAALALTRADCIAPLAHPRERQRIDAWRGQLLDQADARGAAALSSDSRALSPLTGDARGLSSQLADPRGLSPLWRHRLALRRASVHASLAFAAARDDVAAGRSPDANTASATAAQRALAEMASVQPTELTDDDLPAYRDAAMRSNAVRWAAASASGLASTVASAAPNRPNQPTLISQPGEPGQTCVLLIDAQHPAASPLAKRCSWGVVWMASATRNREGNAMALAVQPTDGWRELWLLRRSAAGWAFSVQPPAATTPGVGYAEFAGWAAGGQQVLVAREALAEGRYKRNFKVMNLDTGAVERQAGDASLLGAFGRWADAAWKAQSLALR